MNKYLKYINVSKRKGPIKQVGFDPVNGDHLRQVGQGRKHHE